MLMTYFEDEEGRIWLVPQHKHMPKKVELQRLAVQSFAKPVKDWRPDNAPVKGLRYKSYVEIANKTEELLIS
jgi:hypothetical protein